VGFHEYLHRCWWLGFPMQVCAMALAWWVVHDGGCMLGRCNEVHGGYVVGFGLWGMVEAQKMVGTRHGVYA